MQAFRRVSGNFDERVGGGKGGGLERWFSGVSRQIPLRKLILQVSRAIGYLL